MNKKYVAIALFTALVTGQCIAHESEKPVHHHARSPHHAAPASPGRRTDGFTDYAKVISASPIYETVKVAHPEKHCREEQVPPHRHGGHPPRAGMTVVKAGAVSGNPFARNIENVDPILANPLVLKILDDEYRHHSHNHAHTTPLHRCKQVDRYVTEKRQVGYRVEYRYKGKTFVTRSEEHPGRRIPIRVSVEAPRHL